MWFRVKYLDNYWTAIKFTTDISGQLFHLYCQISTKWIGTKFGGAIIGAQLICHADFCDPLTFILSATMTIVSAILRCDATKKSWIGNMLHLQIVLH